MQHQELRRDHDGGPGGGPEFQAAAFAPEAAAARALLRVADGTQGKGTPREVRLKMKRMGYRMGPRLRELMPRGLRELRGRIHATWASYYSQTL